MQARLLICSSPISHLIQKKKKNQVKFYYQRERLISYCGHFPLLRISWPVGGKTGANVVYKFKKKKVEYFVKQKTEIVGTGAGTVNLSVQMPVPEPTISQCMCRFRFPLHLKKKFGPGSGIDTAEEWPVPDPWNKTFFEFEKNFQNNATMLLKCSQSSKKNHKPQKPTKPNKSPYQKIPFLPPRFYTG